MANIITHVTMYDTIHDNAHRIPGDAAKVAVYVTGSPDILWTPADVARFSHAGRVRVDQSPGGALYAAGAADLYDVEQNAGTPEVFAAAALKRASKQQGNNVYSSRSNLQPIAAALDGVKPGGWWHGMNLWLADPDLNLAEATALIGTLLDNFTVRSVQWAWPTTNPNTEIEGGTLGELGIDLSVADAAWFPAPAATWQEQAANELAGAQVHLANLGRILAAHL